MTIRSTRRILYLADVPVESSYHGSALLYRLLQNHPPELLMVVEGSIWRSLPERRLSGVRYEFFDNARPRLLNSRFHRPYSAWLSLRSRSWASQLHREVDRFNPDLVLTVAHGYLWVTAAEVASRREIPLHLIVHDDWPSVARLPFPFAGRVDRLFRSVYTAAASRLCVSPFMVEEFKRRYGVDGEVLYPSRAPGAACPHDRHDGPSSVTFAFAGTINGPGYWRLLDRLALCLEAQGGNLLIFGPATADQARSAGVVRKNMRFEGLLPSGELIRRLSNVADVLFVPMSFVKQDRPNMEISFPSKLTDYTATGLPLLIFGPSYCSAARWARDNKGVAALVECEEEGALEAEVAHLSRDVEYRSALADEARRVGERYFSPEAAEAVFHSALARPSRGETIQ